MATQALLLFAIALAHGSAQVSTAHPLGLPPDSCPVTRAGDVPFVPPAPQPETAPFGAAWYGTEALRTGLPRDGMLLGRRHKVFWWSAGWEWRRDHRPRLTVTARRLDVKGESAAASRATNAHAADIGHAMLVGLTFPAGGCWEVTGEYQGRSLSFVAWVR